MNLTIDAQRLSSEIEELSRFSDAAAPAVTRVVFTPTDMNARSWIKARCLAAGLEVREDAVGNMFARWDGSDPRAAVVGTGSHIDAIPNAGKYDGVVGVLGGLEAIRALRASGFHPRHSIELLVFTSEEPTRFGIGCLGSRLLSGALSPDAARKLTDNDGVSLDEARRQAGFIGRLEDARLGKDYYTAFVELHIEQGPLLERDSVPLGVVEKIAAPASLRLTVEGAGGHAGGVLMPDRRDALCAAGEVILALENAAKSSGVMDTVATVGICDVFPGAVNSIPARVRLSVDVRDTNLQRRDGVLRILEETCRAVETKRRVTIQSELLNADAPAECADLVVSALRQSCDKQGFRYLPMTSRAYHDSLFISRIAPVAMLFIPCRNGYSHRPDEYASPEDIVRGATVLAETLAALAS
ncbi:MAG TPA: M20 family metallo-hydrolase [Terriglobales bacterium]|nr:M20 family metallo-hydrolase [Terriglobales bacterium]